MHQLFTLLKARVNNYRDTSRQAWNVHLSDSRDGVSFRMWRCNWWCFSILDRSWVCLCSIAQLKMVKRLRLTKWKFLAASLASSFTFHIVSETDRRTSQSMDFSVVRRRFDLYCICSQLLPLHLQTTCGICWVHIARQLCTRQRFDFFHLPWGKPPVRQWVLH